MCNKIARSFAVGMYTGHGVPDRCFKTLERLYKWRILKTQIIISPILNMADIPLFMIVLLVCSIYSFVNMSTHCLLLVTLAAGSELTEEALPAPHHAQPAALQPGSHARHESRLPPGPLARPLQPQQLS